MLSWSRQEDEQYAQRWMSEAQLPPLCAPTNLFSISQAKVLAQAEHAKQPIGH